jgi:hypothetical protein
VDDHAGQPVGTPEHVSGSGHVTGGDQGAHLSGGPPTTLTDIRQDHDVEPVLGPQAAQRVGIPGIAHPETHVLTDHHAARVQRTDKDVSDELLGSLPGQFRGEW